MRSDTAHASHSTQAKRGRKATKGEDSSHKSNNVRNQIKIERNSIRIILTGHLADH